MTETILTAKLEKGFDLGRHGPVSRSIGGLCPLGLLGENLLSMEEAIKVIAQFGLSDAVVEALIKPVT